MLLKVLLVAEYWKNYEYWYIEKFATRTHYRRISRRAMERKFVDEFPVEEAA